MKPARTIHVLFGIAAFAGAIACLVNTDALVPGLGRGLPPAVSGGAFRGVIYVVALFVTAGIALIFPSNLKRRFSPQQRSGYLIGESAWYALGYFCFVVAAALVVVLRSAQQ